MTFVYPKLYDLDPGPECPELVRMIVEIPKNSANKIEYDGELGVFRLDRALYSPMHYPGDYGFIPGTLAEDGDPLDVLVLVSEPSFTGCLIEVRPIGLLRMVDREEMDEKVIAVPTRNPRYDEIHTIDQVFPHVRRGAGTLLQHLQGAGGARGDDAGLGRAARGAARHHGSPGALPEKNRPAGLAVSE